MPDPPIGVIAALTKGFEVAAGHLPLLLIPLLIDLLLWVGPRVSLIPLHEPTQGTVLLFWELATEDSQLEDVSLPETPYLSPTSEAPAYLPFGFLPTVIAGRKAQPLPFGYTPINWRIDTPLIWFGLNLAALGLGLGVDVIFCTIIARRIRQGGAASGRFAWRYAENLLQIIGLLMAAIIGLIFLLYPFVLAAQAAASLGPIWDELVLAVGLFVVVRIALYGVFTIPAMLMDDRNVFHALWDSIRVVQWNVPATLIFILLIVLVSAALRLVWQMADTGSWVVLLGMFGNAFVSTGLIAALFIFYKDRRRHWIALRSVLLEELESQRRGFPRAR